MFLIVLVVSIGVMTQVEPANRPPQLFQSNANLQQLWDVHVNMTDSRINCDECSAAYLVKSMNVLYLPIVNYA